MLSCGHTTEWHESAAAMLTLARAGCLAWAEQEERSGWLDRERMPPDVRLRLRRGDDGQMALIPEPSDSPAPPRTQTAPEAEGFPAEPAATAPASREPDSWGRFDALLDDRALSDPLVPPDLPPTAEPSPLLDDAGAHDGHRPQVGQDLPCPEEDDFTSLTTF